jgi:hypothetical protein
MYILALKKLTCWQTVSFSQLLVNSETVHVELQVSEYNRVTGTDLPAVIGANQWPVLAMAPYGMRAGSRFSGMKSRTYRRQ